MSPGRELDAIIATKVFGLVQSETHPHLWRDPSHFANAAMPLPNYSTSMSDAFQVSEHMEKKCSEGMFSLMGPDRKNSKPWRAFFSEKYPEIDIDNIKSKEFLEVYSDNYVLGDTAPHAICLAALKVVEGK